MESDSVTVAKLTCPSSNIFIFFKSGEPPFPINSLFACWFQPALTSQPTVFSSHKKTNISQPKPAPAPTSEQARIQQKYILLKKYNRNTSFKSISGTAEEREKAKKPTKQFSTAEIILV